MAAQQRKHRVVGRIIGARDASRGFHRFYRVLTLDWIDLLVRRGHGTCQLHPVKGAEGHQCGEGFRHICDGSGVRKFIRILPFGWNTERSVRLCRSGIDLCGRGDERGFQREREGTVIRFWSIPTVPRSERMWWNSSNAREMKKKWIRRIEPDAGASDHVSVWRCFDSIVLWSVRCPHLGIINDKSMVCWIRRTGRKQLKLYYIKGEAYIAIVTDSMIVGALPMFSMDWLDGFWR